jgi:hypothetical protein
MDPKQEFIDKAATRMDEFYQLLRGIFLEYYKKTKQLQAAGDEPAILAAIKEAWAKVKVHEKPFKNMLKEFHAEMIKLQIGEEDDTERRLHTSFEKVAELFSNPSKAMDQLTDEFENDLQKETKIEGLRQSEPIEEKNLGPIDISKSKSKDEIEEELFKLHESQQEAISTQEKEQIQNKIDHLLRLYKDSAFRGRKK